MAPPGPRIKVFTADDTESLEAHVNAWLVDSWPEVTVVGMLFSTSLVERDLTAFSVLIHYSAVPS